MNRLLIASVVALLIGALCIWIGHTAMQTKLTEVSGQANSVDELENGEYGQHAAFLTQHLPACARSVHFRCWPYSGTLFAEIRIPETALREWIDSRVDGEFSSAPTVEVIYRVDGDPCAIGLKDGFAFRGIHRNAVTWDYHILYDRATDLAIVNVFASD